MRALTSSICVVVMTGCLGSIFGPTPQPPMTAPDSGTMPMPPECEGPPGTPTRVPLRRLNFTEHDNALASLTGTPMRPLADAQLRDAVQRGFTNNGEVLTVDPTLVEIYAAAAEDVARDVMVREFDPGHVTRFEVETRQQDGGPGTLQQTCCGDDSYNNRVQPWSCLGATPPSADQCFREFYNAYRVHTATWLDGPGTWTVTTRSYGLPIQIGHPYPDGGLVPDGGELPDGGVQTLMPAQFHLSVNGRLFAFDPITWPQSAPQVQTLTLPNDVVEQPGFYEFDFFLDGWVRDVPRAGADFLEIRRTSGVIPQTQWRVRGTCDISTTRACLDDTLTNFAHRAWRRPVTQTERDTLIAFIDTALAAGDTPLEAFETGLTRVMLSPWFLYRVETASADDPTRLSGVSLATRLSTLLWSSVPDDALLARAESGELDTDEGVRLAASQMLADPRAMNFERDFGGQWLGAPLVSQAALSTTAYPLFTPAVKASMEQEIRLSFSHVLRTRAPSLELVDPDYTFVDDTLAGHYGLPLPGSATPVRVALSTKERGGVLSWGGLLAYNSKPVNPMPTRRGHFLVAQILCDEPPPPPGGIPPAEPMAGLTIRQVFEEHARNPACAGCHATMDPLGFGLESYDADGRWRTVDATGLAIDSTGRLPDGRTFNGPLELKGVLREDPRTRSCIAQQLYVYATNRSFVADDRCQLPPLVGGTTDTLPDLIERIVSSKPFTAFRAETAP